MKKENLKKLQLVVLAAATMVFATGCGKAAEDNAAQTAAEAEVTQEETQEETQAVQETAESSDTQEPAGEVTTIYAATSAAPRPFTYQDESGELTGHNIELIKAVFDKLPQYKLEIEITEFSSIFAGLDADKYQLGVNNFAMNDERKEKYLYTDPEMVNNYIVVANENVNVEEITDMTELAGTSFIGGPGNDKTTVVETYNETHPDQLIEIVYDENPLLEQLQMVESGKADFLIIDAPMYYGYYQPEFNLNLKDFSLENVKSATYSYFIVNKGNEQLLEDINAALAEVIADGTSTEISIKYLGEDYSPGITE